MEQLEDVKEQGVKSLVAATIDQATVVQLEDVKEKAAVVTLKLCHSASTRWWA